MWWPGLDEDIQTTVQQCDACQLLGRKPPESPMYPWEWPSVPWKRIHIDYAGPCEGTMMILFIVDAGSKFIESHVLVSATASNTVDKLRRTFATHGLPQTIVSDNGTNFASQVFEEFCEKNGIQHIFVSPYRTASNRLVERAVQM